MGSQLVVDTLKNVNVGTPELAKDSVFHLSPNERPRSKIESNESLLATAKFEDGSSSISLPCYHPGCPQPIKTAVYMVWIGSCRKEHECVLSDTWSLIYLNIHNICISKYLYIYISIYTYINM